MRIHSALLIYLCDISLAYMIIYGTWRSHYGDLQVPWRIFLCFLPHSINMHISWIGNSTDALSVFVCMCIYLCVRACAVIDQ